MIFPWLAALSEINLTFGFHGQNLQNGPLLGFIVPRIAVLVDMTSPVKGLRTLVQAINIVKENPWDLIIFPEGGRFTDGTVHDFLVALLQSQKKLTAQ